MSSSSTFSPSSFLSFFDFPVVAASSATVSSSSSASSHSHAQRPSSLFDLSCLQPDINSPPVVTSPVPAAAPHSHFFPAGAGGGGGHTRSASTSTLSSSSSSPSLRSSLPPCNASSLSSCVSPKSPPTTASAANAPPLTAAASSSGQGAFGFELSSLTSWLDSLFPAEDAAPPPAQQPDSKQQQADCAAPRASAQQAAPGQPSAANTQSGRRPCRPRLSPSSSSPASSASLVRALSSNPKKAAASAASSAKGDVNIAHPASSPMSIARTSALLSRKSVASTSPPSPPVDLDEKVATLLAGDRQQRSVRGGVSGGGALSPLPEVQLVEALTPDSPSHTLTLDVHRTDRAATDGAETVEALSNAATSHGGTQRIDASSESQQYVDFVIAGIPVGQPPVSPPSVPHFTTTSTRSALQRSPFSPPSPPPASLLSSALLEADLDYFHVERDAAVAIEQLSTTPPPLPHSPHSANDDGAELAWEDDEEEAEAEDEAQVVRLRDEGKRHGRAGGRADEEDWEVCRVQEGSGGTDDEYEML